MDFSDELKKSIQGYLTRYESKRSSILPILHAIQDEKDWISDEDIKTLEAEYGLSAVDVREVLTFYTMYRQSPPKPYRFEVCKSISCWLMGADKTIKAIRDEIKKAEEQGRPLPFECKEAECLAQCGYAPATLINKNRHNNVTPETALELIKQYTQQELPKAAQNCQKSLKKTPEQRT